ncbi:MAG: hypothetical protein QOG48_2109 [Verrucomicrobiota bacterium]|jgi:tetratricopeptide (TPR) repeat protein
MNDEPSTISGRRTRARKKRTLIWILVLVFIVIAATTAKFAYHGLKRWRADQFAAQAETFTRTEKWNDAAQKYSAALQLDPLNYRALSGAARLATRLGRPEAIDLWEEVIKKPESTTQDRQDYADLLVRLGRLKIAEPFLDKLLKSDPDAKTLSIASMYTRKMGDRAKAVEFARIAAKRAPNDDRIRFQLTELLAASASPEEQKEAKQILWDLSGPTHETRQAAIEALAKAPGLSAEERTRVLQMLDSLQNATITDALLAADLRIQLHPEQAEKIYDQTIARWNSGSVNEVVDLARWLNIHQQPERVLSLSSIEQASKDNQLLMARLDALAILSRWNDIDTLLAHPDLTLDPSVLESFRARTAQERGAALDAEVHWNHALSLSNADPGKLRFVANFAQQSHATAVALKAYDQLGKYPEHADFAIRQTQLLSAHGVDLNVQRTAAEKTSTRKPEDPNAAAQLAYLNLLAGVDVDQNAAAAKSLVEKYPDRLSYRVAAALGYLRRHDPGPALAQFKVEGAPPIEWQKTAPNWRAVYAAALRANEQEDAAREIIATIPKDKLTAEERALIE